MFKNLNFFEFFKDIILPPICTVCGKINSELLCQECYAKVKMHQKVICNLCGKPFLDYNHMYSSFDKSRNYIKICALCKNESFNFYRLRSFSLYGRELKKVIHKYKYNKIYSISKILINFLKQAYSKYYRREDIDYIETVPDFVSAGSEGMQNHMQVIAEKLSNVLNIPFINNIIKIKKTSRQQKLNLFQRKSNLKEAFKVRNNLLVSGKNILLIDDIWTTGTTLNEISTVLKKSGANNIYLLVIARGV